MTAALSTAGLCRSFGALAVASDIDFVLPQGARHALIGPNGAGKSTLINLMTGALEPTSGRVLLDGDDVTRLPAEARVKRGLVRTFQINTLFPEMTPMEATTLAVGERLGLGFRMWRAMSSCRQAIDEATVILDRLGLAGDARRPTHELAYGRQRLVEIALALASQPRVLLLDEPAGNLDPTATYDLERLIDAMHGAGTKIVMTTHDLGQARRVADEILFFSHGRLLEHAPAAEFFARPRSAAAAAFIEGRLFRDAESPISR
jgi:branched-chain amino acid transport system ATP-binding protein